MTLPELLIAMTVVGIILSVLTASLLTTMRATPAAQQRVLVARDVSFLEAWIPADLATATATNTDPVFDPTSSGTLPGTNAFTLWLAPTDGGLDSPGIVSYRYLNDGGEWQLVRFDVLRPGTVRESFARVVIARQLAAPAATWTPAQAPQHAVNVIDRTTSGRVALDIVFTFDRGETATTGGSALPRSALEALSETPELSDPSSPGSRCGGRISLVLDTSGSVPKNRGGESLKQAAVQFIDTFRGTPVLLSIIGFDNTAYAMAPANPGAYLDMLGQPADIDAARNRILALDDRDGTWTNGKPKDWPKEDGIHWSQTGEGTNWDAALHLPVMDFAGTPWPSRPNLIVLVTDGFPNTRMNSSLPLNPIDAAAAKADIVRSMSAQVIGILVGEAARGNSAVSHMSAVAGPVLYDETANGGIGNVADADVYRAAFTNVAEVLSKIMALECGGTITLQKRVQVANQLQAISDGSVWTFDTPVGDATIDHNSASSVTFDTAFERGDTSRIVRVSEVGAPPGYVFDRVECRRRGQVVAGRVTVVSNGSDGSDPTFDIDLRPDEALSCFVISRRA